MLTDVQTAHTLANTCHTYPETLSGMASLLSLPSRLGATEHLVPPGPHIRPLDRAHLGPRGLVKEGVGSEESWL